MRFEDKTILVTGAGSGIGRATAQRFREEGATVVVLDIDEESGKETIDTMADTEPGSGRFHQLDVTNWENFESIVNDVAENEGLDVLVNNAGTMHPLGPMETIDQETRDHIIDLNIKGVWNGCSSALPIMRNQGHGAIVNVASLAAVFGFPLQAGYSLTKGAIPNYTRALAAEAGPSGVRINSVCPGITDTPLVRGVLETLDDPESAREGFVNTYPLGRLGEPEDIADAILFLSSDEASWITGENLVVDGGFQAAGGDSFYMK
ncbi:SDR family NAD(P)-dependent oxidoreductase [Halocatena halophila]|uniref:SDR family NAD(P)-dependent oxidoreductase n=1 Tax=Halocatena halophila TaxID=2814576 RepID=UPI002ECFC950